MDEIFIIIIIIIGHRGAARSVCCAIHLLSASSKSPCLSFPTGKIGAVKHSSVPNSGRCNEVLFDRA